MRELSDVATQLDLTTAAVGIAALVVFLLAYAVVIGEEYWHLRKSMPVLVAAGIIWALIGWRYSQAANAATDPACTASLARSTVSSMSCG